MYFWGTAKTGIPTDRLRWVDALGFTPSRVSPVSHSTAAIRRSHPEPLPACAAYRTAGDGSRSGSGARLVLALVAPSCSFLDPPWERGSLWVTSCWDGVQPRQNRPDPSRLVHSSPAQRDKPENGAQPRAARQDSRSEIDRLVSAVGRPAGVATRETSPTVAQCQGHRSPPPSFVRPSWGAGPVPTLG